MNSFFLDYNVVSNKPVQQVVHKIGLCQNRCFGLNWAFLLRREPGTSVCVKEHRSLSCFALTQPLLPAWPMCQEFVTSSVQNNSHSQSCFAPHSGVWVMLSTAQDPSAPYQLCAERHKGVGAVTAWHGDTTQLWQPHGPRSRDYENVSLGCQQGFALAMEADPHPKTQNDGQKPARGAHAKALCYLPKQEIRGIVGLHRGF